MANAKQVNRNSGYAYLDPGDGASGLLPISDNDPLRTTYSLFVNGVVPAATPTDLLNIQGAAGVITKIRSIVITGTATAASNVMVSLVRRSTANTGGTSVAQTGVKRDSIDGAAGSTILLYSANPSGVGTLVGTADGGRLNLAPAANGGIDRLVLQYSWFNEKPPTLRGVGDFLSINLGGIAWPAGGSLDIAIAFTEE